MNQHEWVRNDAAKYWTCAKGCGVHMPYRDDEGNVQLIQSVIAGECTIERERWLTLGAFRAMTQDLSNETPITVDSQALPGLIENPSWFNLEFEEEDVARVLDGDASSLILTLRDTFDTRQW